MRDFVCVKGRSDMLEREGVRENGGSWLAQYVLLSLHIWRWPGRHPSQYLAARASLPGTNFPDAP